MPQEDYYALKVEQLRAFEELAQRGLLDIYYGDEAAICTQGSVCSGWQWSDEEVFLPAQKGGRLSCFALLSRANTCRFATTQDTIDAAFVARQLEQLSWDIDKPTLVVLDNARLHKGTLIQSFRDAWEARGLFVFYLPVYSPHLNIVEILWKHLKYFWLRAEDYLDWQNLFYQVHQALAAVGSLLHIHFSPFKHQ